MNIAEYQIQQDSSILDAMKRLTEHGIDVLLVVNTQNQVQGLLTDGDLRRGIVSGKSQNHPVRDIMSRNFISIKEGEDEDRAFLLDMMIAQSIRHLPVIGEQSELRGIHFLSHIIGRESKPNIAVIMAGGKGVRLRPITENCPKPMLKIAGRPILERIVLHLVSHGITNIYISLNYMGYVIESYFKDGSDYGCKITYLKETEALGTGGALSLLKSIPEHPMIVMNGDLVTDINLTDMLSFHQKTQSSASIASKKTYTKISYGVINKNDDEFLGITEKPTIEHEISVGTYVLSPECLPLIPKSENFPITDLFGLLKKEEKKVSVYETEEDWIDIGRPGDLKKAMGYDD
jgi:dTDP-glucose pyrophosphorylase